tara:strand:+ start:802 stop:4860 length:4059 start_codon:yes stop_codon:yes gene_type:complete
MANELNLENLAGVAGELSGLLSGDPGAPSTDVAETTEPQKPAEQTQPQGDEEEEGVNPLEEAAAVIGGGAIDAAESVGGFAELTGDTLKTGLNQLLGRPIDETQNPFDENYVHGDADFLQIPDMIQDNKGNVLWEDAQPKTAIGRFGRGLVEFGLLSVGTAGAGGAALGGARLGVRGLAAARAMGVGAKGSRYIKYIQTGARIGSEGAIADLISSSSEHANIMNLAQENIPWAVPLIGDMVAVKPEDNPWTARFKSVIAGAGINYVGHAIGAIYKGFWAAGRARKAGKTVDEANVIGNDTAAADFDANMARDEAGRTEMAVDQYQQGVGVSRADPKDEYIRSYNPERYDEWAEKRFNELDEDAAILDEIEVEAKVRGEEVGDIWDEDIQSNTLRIEEDANRSLGEFVNENRFSQTEKATVVAPEGAVRQHVQETINSRKAGGESKSYTPIISESYLRALSRGDANIRKYVEEVADDISDAAFKNLDNRLPWDEVKTTVLKQANELLEVLEGGGDIATNFRNALEKPDAYRTYADNNNAIVTISPTQKAASVLVMNALGKQIEGVAKGTLTISDQPIGRQAETLFDSLKVLLEENKKMGMMWGLDGKAQQQYVLSPTLQNMKQRSLAEVSQEMDEYFTQLRTLITDSRFDELEDLMELHALSGGKVRTIDHIHEYLRAQLRGGRMDDVHIKGRVRKELQGTFFNSVLSSFATPVKAVIGTNMLARLRPMQAWMGAALRGNQKEMFLANAQMQNMGQAWAESLQMAKYNWDLGVKRQNQTYQGKFDFASDLKEWKSLKKHYEKYGSEWEKVSYGFLDQVVNLNTSPWIKYSSNAMGSGDAAARTIIGRQYMRQRAAAAAWDANSNNRALLSTDELQKIAVNTEDQFRDEIFKVNRDGKYVVSDKAASMAGDEAAMTRTLQENFKGFELISNIPGMKAFFPFVRTGFNYLDVTFQHTPLALFRDKYHDILQLSKSSNPSQALLYKYGIRAEDLPYELAIMEGRMAMGTAVVGLATIAALSGNITGDSPVNKEDADLWRLNGIKPKSFKFGDTYVSYEKLEIFNTIFSTTANVVGHSDLLGEKKTDEWMKKLTYMTAAVLVDQSMLSGVEDLAKLMNPQSAEDLLARSGSRYIRSHLPFAGLMGQVGDVLDSNQREANTFLELLVRRDAMFKQAIPPKYDILAEDRSGKELRYGPDQPLWRLFNSLSPIGLWQSEGDEVKEALQAIRFNLPETMKTYQGQELSSLEQSKMAKELATGSLRKDLERIIKHPSFKKALRDYKKLSLKESDGYKLNDQLFYDAVAKTFRRHKKLAMQKLLQENGILSAQLAVRKEQKAMGKSGNYDKQRIEYLVSQFPK